MKHSTWSSTQLRHSAIALVGLWLLTLALLGPAYQVRLPQTLAISTSDWLYANGYIKGLYPQQGSDSTPDRFTDGNARITLPAPGQLAPLQIALAMNAWRPDRAGEIDVSVNGVPLRHFVNFEWRIHRLVITDTARLQPNALEIGIASDTWKPQDYDPANPDPSTFGILLHSITLTPLEGAGGWVVPGWELLFLTAILASGIYLAGVWLELPRFGFVLAVAVIGLFAALVVFARYTAATYLPAVTLLAALALFVANRARPQPKPISRRVRWAFVLVVLLVAFNARLALVERLPRSVDEFTYMVVSTNYANLLESGNRSRVLTDRGNIEHPVFNKLLFAVGILAGRALGAAEELASARAVALAAATLQTALVAVLNPFAAAFLALHTIHIQFSSLAYLEAVPAFTSTLAVMAFDRARRHGKKWLYVSAIALGLTAASKYIYAIVGLAILPFLLWRWRREPRHIIGYLLVAPLCFLFANPILWTDPAGVVRETLAYHFDYSGSAGVASVGRPAWWHLYYLLRVREWETLTALPPDTWILVLGVLGLVNLWQRHRVYFAWFVVALGFLLIWNTKWEQYAMTLVTPLCLSAGWAITALAGALTRRAVRVTARPQAASADAARYAEPDARGTLQDERG